MASSREEIIRDCLKSLEHAPEIQFNPAYKRAFKACLARELSRHKNVEWVDRYPDMFRFVRRWIRRMQQMLQEDPNLEVANVAQVAAFEAGIADVDTVAFICEAVAIVVNVWKRGEEVASWWSGSSFRNSCPKGCYCFRYAFPLRYLYLPDPRDVKKVA